MSVFRIRIPASAIKQGWHRSQRLMEDQKDGTTPTKPKGAVRTVMARADSERTWKMMTTNMQTIMIGITAASAVFALQPHVPIDDSRSWSNWLNNHGQLHR